MSRTRMKDRRHATAPRVDRATVHFGDYGRLVRPDGTTKWWVRASNGAWVALGHERVSENEDGSITLLYLQ